MRRKIITMAAAAVLALAATGCEDGGTDAAGPYAVGDTFAMGELEHTLHAARWSTGDEQGSLDGELGAGRSMRGEIAFSVQDGGSEWELLFEPQLSGFGQAIYEVSADDVREG